MHPPTASHRSIREHLDSHGQADLEMKAEALARCDIRDDAHDFRWRTPELLEFLRNLCRNPGGVPSGFTVGRSAALFMLPILRPTAGRDNDLPYRDHINLAVT
jgi:hypothetical protein